MKTTNKYPYYEKDQVLSAQNLNDTTNFLEHQDLLTRRLLIGTGIACGLDFSHNDGVVTIVAGNGVTSMGYIIDFCRTKEYSKVRDYSLPDKPKYSPFHNKTKKPFQLWELCNKETVEGDNLGTLKSKGEKFIRDKVVVLFLEIDHVDLKNCIEGDCDDKGSEFVFKVVPLLIGVKDLMLYFSEDGDTLEDLNSAMLAKYSIKEINCPRFDVLANRLTTHEQIAESFRDNINLVIPKIDMAIALMQALYSEKMGQGEHLTEAWKFFKKQLEKTKKDSESVQQAYDYLCTLAAAINQFADEAAEWVVNCCPDIDLFPQHLALGELTNLGTEVPKIFRNYFVYAPTSPLAHEKQGSVKFYFERVLGMLNFYRFGEEDQVKIIPSVYGRENLSDKAIPFYLQSNEKVSWNWLKKWNYAKSDYGRWKKNTYYYNTPETFLDLDIEPYSFFRIEGHIGKNYMDAISSVQKEIDSYRVPIKLVALSTGGLPIDANPIPESRFQDLEALFDAAKSELFCSLEGPLCFLSSISIAEVFGQRNIAGEASKSAGSASIDLKNMFGETASTGNLNMVRYEGMAKSMAREYVYQKYIISHIKGQFLTQKCNVEQETFGSSYLGFINKEPYKSTRLLELFQNQAGVSAAGQSKILLFILIAVDEIEELVALTKPATLSNFKFDELKVFIIGFRKFLNLFIDLIEAYKKNNDNTLPSYLEGVTDRLNSLKTICSLKKIVTILNEHRLRTIEILEEWKFENFTRKHPGIEHKAGVTPGGTFIMVFHSTEEPEKFVPLTLDDIKIAMPTLSVLKAYSVGTSEMKSAEKLAGEAPAAALHTTTSKESISKKLAQEEFYAYAKRTGRVVNQKVLDKFEGLFIKEREEEEALATDGTVLFDFFLPYICCGEGGGVEYNLPEPKVLISLDTREFCKNDENEHEFTLSPKGGQVTGPGLRESGDDYFFSPSKEDVNAGKISFSYVVQGRAASFSIQVSEEPVADFEYSIDSTPNGSYVSFTNKSSGAKGYTWKFGDPTGSGSSEENPTHYYSPQQENAKVVLIAANDICGEDTKEVDIQLFEKKYEMTFIEIDTFCENDKTQHEIIVRIQNRGEESPLKGTVKGTGVKQPTAAVNRARFVPTAAGKGSHELTYEVDGVIEAKLTATVQESFNASFSVVAKTTEFGLDMKITNIQPKGAGSYFWYMDPTKPTLFSVSKTDDADFSFLLDSTLVSNDKTFPIRLEVFKGYCSANQTEIVTNPFGNNDPIATTPSPFGIAAAIARQKGIEADMNAMDTTGNKTTLGTATYKKFVSAKKLTKDMATAFETISIQKALLTGKSNASIASTFKKELDAINALIPTRITSVSKKKTGLIARVYANVYMSLLNMVFAQSKDLKVSDNLYATYSGADSQIAKAYKAGLTAKVKAAVKTLNTSAAAENSKPIASGVAINNKTVLK
jgi:PKD repeat protein